MDIQSIFSIQTVFLALAVGVLTQMVKNIVEAKWPNLPANKNWGKVFIPSISLGIGMALSAGTSVIPGFLANAVLQDKIIYGIISGFFSSYVFRAANAFLKKEVPDESINPPAIPAPPKVPSFPTDKDK